MARGIRDRRIVSHHVGARGFGVAFNPPERFKDDTVHVLYEADRECAEAMRRQNMDGRIFVLPYCLSDKEGRATLHLTRNPYASSILEPSADYERYYCEVMLSGSIDGVDVQGAYYDAVYGNENAVERGVAVETVSLNALSRRSELPLGMPPDLLSVDTQGSELHILSGASDMLGTDVLAVATEIEFHPMYKSQPLFSDLFDLMLRNGFHFAGFTHLQEISPHRAPLGQRARGFVAFGDALFLRRIDSIEALPRPTEDKLTQLNKLAFIAITFGYLEYALQALERSAALGALAAAPGGPAYLGFLEALKRAADAMPRAYLHVQRHELVTRRRAEQEAERREAARRAAKSTGSSGGPSPGTVSHDGPVRRGPGQVIADALGPLGVTWPVKAVRAVLGRVFRRLAGVEAPPQPPPALPPPATEIEAVLAEYGFAWLAYEVRRRRLAAEPFVDGAQAS